MFKFSFSTETDYKYLNPVFGFLDHHLIIPTRSFDVDKLKFNSEIGLCPKMKFLKYLNRFPCKGLVKKSVSIFSVGKCLN